MALKVREDVDEVSDPVYLKSSLDLINQISRRGAYSPGDLVVVSAPPKAGSSTFLCQEGANFLSQGCPVAHISLGEMEISDVWVRYVARLQGEKLSTVVENWRHYVNLSESCMTQTWITDTPALSMNVHDIVRRLEEMRLRIPFRAFVLDGGWNIKPTKDSTSKAEIETYAVLKQFAESQGVVGLISVSAKAASWTEGAPRPTEAVVYNKQRGTVDYVVELCRNKEDRGSGTVAVSHPKSVHPKSLSSDGRRRILCRVAFDDAAGRISETRENE